MTFPQMRRPQKALSYQQCIDLLVTSKRGVMSVNGQNGYPYGMPLNHYYDQESNKIYFHGGNEGYRIDCVRNDPRVSYCIISEPHTIENHWALRFESVIVYGTVRFIEDEKEIVEIVRRLSHRFTDDENYIEAEIRGSLYRTSLMEMSIDHISGKKIVES